MDIIPSTVPWKPPLVYLEVVIVFSTDDLEPKKDCADILQLLRAAGVTPKLKKDPLFLQNVYHIGA